MCDPVSAMLALGAGATVYGASKDSKSQKNALKQQEAQRAASQAYIEKQISQARSDIFKLFPSAQESRQKGLDAGLQLYKQAYPAMMNTFQQGNVAAQQAVIAGLPQMQNALIKGRVDMSAFNPVSIQQPQGLTLPQNVQAQNINEMGLG